MSRQATSNHSPALKAKVALEAVKGEYTLVEQSLRNSVCIRIRSPRRQVSLTVGPSIGHDLGCISYLPLKVLQ